MKKIVFILAFLSCSVFSSPILQMNKALNALIDLLPFITDESEFKHEKHTKKIAAGIHELQSAFKTAKHDKVLKSDLFAPSYAIITEELSEVSKAFNKGKKDFSHWRLKEVTAHCLDCHSRLPKEVASSFQSGDLQLDKSRFNHLYNLGIAQLIVRRAVDAKWTFTQVIDESFIKKDFRDIKRALKQILLIDVKILKSPSNLIPPLKKYLKKESLPTELSNMIKAWIPRLEAWEKKEILKNGIQTEAELRNFLDQELRAFKKMASLSEADSVDLLAFSGLLSNYFFTHPKSKLSPELNFWLGWIEKYLKRDLFFGPGDYFLKQCVRRYPEMKIAKECLEEYKESVNFDFSGSSGTNVPSDVTAEIRELEKLINKK